MAQTRRRSQASESGDFFDAFISGAEVKRQQDELIVKQKRMELDFIEAAMRQQHDQSKLKIDMLKAGIEPNSGRPLQRGAFNPMTGQKQDVLYDAGTGGNIGAPGYGGGMVIPKGAPQIPAISLDNIEVDQKSGRTFVKLPNGMRMPAIVQIGPGGVPKSVRTFNPSGKEMLMQIIQGGAAKEKTGAKQTAQSPDGTPPQVQPITFDEAVGFIDQALMKGTALDVILTEIDNDEEILPAMKVKLKQEARARFGRKKRGTA